MVAADSSMAAQPDPKTHHPDPDHNHGENNYIFPNLGRQSSIYSLTLDEFQHTLSENGKNFGSMNMDEFLNSIWTAEENHHNHNHNHDHQENNNQNNLIGISSSIGTSKGMIAKQPSLPRQGSLTLPAPLCRKTVDEVWTEIQRTQNPEDEQQQQQQQQQAQQQQERQPTFGEMTLEDFLIKAGVVREQCGGVGLGLPTPPLVPPPPPPAQIPGHHQFGFSGPQMGPAFLARPMIGMGPGGGFQPMPTGESSGYTGNGKRNNGYSGQVVGYGGRMNNGGGFGPGPVSPVSPEGICGPGQVDNTGGQFGMDMGGLRGRKRIIDGPVEKVVERRQRRMIKNRESAARSRARKQAYTVELEAELNQLREENAQLKQALAEIETQRKQQYNGEQNIHAVLTKAQRAQDKLRAMRRTGSCNL